jgi:sugar lactone lactonase YvrE
VKDLTVSHPILYRIFNTPYVWYFNLRFPPLDAATVGNHGPAQNVLLGHPTGLAEDSTGNVYVTDRRGVIWKVDLLGEASIIAGTGYRGLASAGIKALQSSLGRPENVEVDSLGRLYVPDSVNHVVVRLDPDGRLTRVAGIGTPGYRGDGGPALAAELYEPYDVNLDSQGNIYIADYMNHRIRRVTPEGVISTVAGTGTRGYSGDGGAAVASQLNGPYGIAVGPGDDLFIADSYNHVIRRVDASGVITTVAGLGRPGYAGDGGPAQEAMLNAPQALAFDKMGRMYIADEHNHAIRMVSPEGMISTVIGNGQAGFSEDGVLAVQGQLSDPEAVIVRHDGSLLIADADNGRLCGVTSTGLVQAFAGRRKYVASER